MTKIKRIMASCLAAVSVAGALCVSTYAVDYPTSKDWNAVGSKTSGSPSGVTSNPDVITIKHKGAGATAAMLGVDHTLPGASATTVISCDSYTMQSISITNYSTTVYKLKPNVGEPTNDIPVTYRVTAIADSIGDAFTSRGRIAKIW